MMRKIQFDFDSIRLNDKTISMTILPVFFFVRSLVQTEQVDDIG